MSIMSNVHFMFILFSHCWLSPRSHTKRKRQDIIIVLTVGFWADAASPRWPFGSYRENSHWPPQEGHSAGHDCLGFYSQSVVNPVPFWLVSTRLLGPPAIMGKSQWTWPSKGRLLSYPMAGRQQPWDGELSLIFRCALSTSAISRCWGYVFIKSAAGEAWGSRPECESGTGVWEIAMCGQKGALTVPWASAWFLGEQTCLQRAVLPRDWVKGGRKDMDPSVWPATAGQTEYLKLFLSEGQALKLLYIPWAGYWGTRGPHWWRQEQQAPDKQTSFSA